MPQISSFFQHTRFDALWQTLKNVHGPAGERWVAELPERLAQLLQVQQWELLPTVYTLSYHLVLETSAGVLKLGPPCEAFSREIQVLKTYRDCAGVVNLDRGNPDFAYMLLDPLTDQTLGGNYVNAEHDQQLTHTICQLMKTMHGYSPPGMAQIQNMTTLNDYREGFSRYHSRHEGNVSPFDAELVAEAETLYGELCTTAPEPVLLHGDLHGYNVLMSPEAVVIDPKGIVGDPAFEPAAFLSNHLPPHKNQWEHCLAQRIEIFEATFGPRVLPWAFAQMVLSALWHDEDSEDGSETLFIAQLLRKMLKSAHG